MAIISVSEQPRARSCTLMLLEAIKEGMVPLLGDMVAPPLEDTVPLLVDMVALLEVTAALLVATDPLEATVVLLVDMAALLVDMVNLPADTAVEVEQAVMMTMTIVVDTANKDKAVSNIINSKVADMVAQVATEVAVKMMTPAMVVVGAMEATAKTTMTLMDPVDVNNSSSINLAAMDRAIPNLPDMVNPLAVMDLETMIPMDNLVDTVGAAVKTTMITNMALVVVPKNPPMASPTLPMVKLNLLMAKKRAVAMVVKNNNMEVNTTKMNHAAVEDMAAAVIVVVVAVMMMTPMALRG